MVFCFIIYQGRMSRIIGKGHAGGHKDTVQVKLAAPRHDGFDLSVFVLSQTVPSYYMSFNFLPFCKSGSLEIWRVLKGRILRCGFKAGWHFTTACLWHRRS